MTKTTAIALAAIGALACSLPAAAADHLIGQKGKAFEVKALKAKVGDKLVFRNDDGFAHNIFSLSDAQSFDLGSYGQGASREVVLTKEGKLEIECAIHPEMRLDVEVSK